jgi:Na+/melibiose symporter-like transporter
MGQVVDSFCTPLVGYLSDKFNTSIGQRMPWYIIGYVIIISTFPFIYRCVDYGYVGDMIYYATFAGLFNVGWAFCQISHMSLVPAVSCSKSHRV